MSEYKDFEVELKLGENKESIKYVIPAKCEDHAYKIAETILDNKSPSKELIKDVRIRDY